MTPVQKATQATVGIMTFVIILITVAYVISLALPSVVWLIINVVSFPYLDCHRWRLMPHESLPVEIQIMTWLILSMIPTSALVWVFSWLYHRIKLTENYFENPLNRG